MTTLYLILWGAALALIPYAYLRKRVMVPALVVLLLMLSFPIMIGIETPNPDHVRIIQVTQP